MTLLLNRQNNDIQITKKIIKAAAKNKESGKKVITLLLNHWSSKNIEKEQHINFIDIDYKAVLYTAVLLGHEAIIKLLILSSFNINSLFGGDSTALNLVIYEDHNSVV